VDLALLGDPVEDARLLLGETASDGDDIAVRAIIEAIEATYWATRARDGGKAAEKQLRSLLPAFEHLRLNVRLPAALLQDVDFHAAKALNWCGDTDAAEKVFRQILVVNPNEAATRLQLGKILAKRANGSPGENSKAAIEQFEAILAQSADTVSVTVGLAAFGFLSQVDPARAIPLIQSNRARLFSQLQHGLANRLEQPFDVVAQLAGAFWYRGAELVEELFGVVAGQPVPAGDDGVIFAWAQAQKQYAKSKLSKDPESARRLLQEAIASYEQIRELKGWQPVQFADCLVVAREHARALQILDAPNVEQSVHWHHRRAQALRELGRAPEALVEIDHALAQALPKFRSTLLYERWLIRGALGDAQAVADLKEAFDLCEPGEYRDKMAKELALAGKASEAGTETS
jgi:tetratricopeptide (TPR) repeat protein